jgi:hypothetical protein
VQDDHDLSVKGTGLPEPDHHPGFSWFTLAVVTVLGILLLVLMEWIFFVTKPSFLAVLPSGERLAVLALTPLPLLALAWGLLIPLALGSLLSGRQSVLHTWLERIAGLVPATVLGSLFLLMADNFANTMLGWSIQESSGLNRAVAVVLILASYWLGWRVAQAWLRFFGRRRHLGTGLAGAYLVLALLVLILMAGGQTSPQGAISSRPGKSSEPLPNILLLGSDGLNANHLSAYGYERQTTPYLEELVPFSLFCENSFANCDHTTGSLASLLTGRLPTETRVTYPPDILTGEQSYWHLPGLLKGLGYYTEQISIRHYGDAFDVNMRDGFDRAAFRDRRTSQASSRFFGWLGENSGLFFETITDRIASRLAHVVGLGVLPSAYQEAVHADRLTGHTDLQRYEGLAEALSTAPEPFFVHTHFMATHGGYFSPSTQHFSAGQNQDRDWMTDFFDDAILEFDGAVGELIEVLRERGVLDNTMIILYSDHGMRSDARQRTLLMFIFPEGELAGRIPVNVQLLDVAPTIVDFLGLEIPGWMHGRSLLGASPAENRPVFSTGFRGDALRRIVPEGPFEVDAGAAGPPFFSMGSISMVVGQRVYKLDLVDPGLSVQDLADHTAPLPASELPSAQQAGEILVNHLRDRGWDVAGLPDTPPLVDSR